MFLDGDSRKVISNYKSIALNTYKFYLCLLNHKLTKYETLSLDA
jgi:hypothetical protein